MRDRSPVETMVIEAKAQLFGSDAEMHLRRVHTLLRLAVQRSLRTGGENPNMRANYVEEQALILRGWLRLHDGPSRLNAAGYTLTREGLAKLTELELRFCGDG